MSLNIRNLTPMMQQYFEIKATVPEHILFYRLGDFYEMFYEDAQKASEALDLVLTSRNAGGGIKAPLCGVPYHSAQGYIAKLIEKGFTIAICEQVEDPKLAKNLVKREVVKIITQGTLIEENLLKQSEHNYLACVCREEGGYSLSYGDLSTFYIRSSFFSLEEMTELEEELDLLSPSELLVEEGIALSAGIPIAPPHLSDSLLKGFISTPIDPGVKSSLSGLLNYILETQFIQPNTSFDYGFIHRQDHMKLDPTVLSHLELFETLISKEKRGSLLGLLDQSITPMGSRLLREWMARPLQHLSAIELRQDLIEHFVLHPVLLQNLRDILRGVHDLERLLSKVVFSHIMPKDLRKICSTLAALPKLLTDLKESREHELLEGLQEFKELHQQLDETLLEDPAATLAEGGVISPKHFPELQDTLFLLEHGSRLLLELEAREKEQTGIKNLRIRYNRVFGYYIEVTNSNLSQVPEHYIRKQTLVGSERFFTEELKELEIKIMSAEERQKLFEREIYEKLVQEVKEKSTDLLLLSKALARLDAALSLALVAKERDYCRPQVVSEQDMILRESRHPVIEAMLGRENFISNDLSMDEEHHFFIITGPNMAGKSTYLRQVALITLMAHMGSFVPASYAKIPLTDRIFTRVGASDDLSRGKSTFMVEMTELSSILHHATEHSLVILDEIGRGTSTYDGLSIAWATVEYLCQEKSPRCLFATHYHELTEAEESIPGIKNFRIAVETLGRDLIFLRKILPGKSGRSYGIEAAKLAGLPESLLVRASAILKELEEKDPMVKPSTKVMEEQDKPHWIPELVGLDLDQMSPREAWSLLEALKRKYS